MGDGLDSLALRCVAAEREVAQLRALLAEVERERDDVISMAKSAAHDLTNMMLEEHARARASEAELERLREVVGAARVLASVPCRCAWSWTSRNRHDPNGCTWADTGDLRAALAALDAEAPNTPASTRPPRSTPR